MALRLPSSPPSLAAYSPVPSSPHTRSCLCFHPSSSNTHLVCMLSIREPCKVQPIRRFYDTTVARAVNQASDTTAGGLVEVTQETFWPVVEAAGDRLVVVDMYTQWCGPCKIMHPKLVDLSAKYTDVLFLKLDCNQENKALAKSLGIKVVPTFKLFRNRKEIAEVKGAKYDELLQNIKQARAS